MKSTMKSSIRHALGFLLTSVASLGIARADAFEDKFAAEQAKRVAVANAQATAYQVQTLNFLNQQILSRIPRGATVSKCKTHHSYFTWDKSMTIWNGINLETRAGEDPNAGFPPQLGGCHYRDPQTGLDCKIEGYAIRRKGYSKFDKVCL
jgi:hypothetical protein